MLNGSQVIEQAHNHQRQPTAMRRLLWALKHMMELSEYETHFMNLLRESGLDDFSLGRSTNGKLVLTKASPCQEIGYLNIYVGASEIMFSCKISHSHITVSDAAEDSTNVFELATKEVHDFVSDKIAVSVETGRNGEVVSSGWCLKSAIGQITPGYAELMEQLYGGPTQTTYWFWSGQRVAL